MKHLISAFTFSFIFVFFSSLSFNLYSQTPKESACFTSFGFIEQSCINEKPVVFVRLLPKVNPACEQAGVSMKYVAIFYRGEEKSYTYTDNIVAFDVPINTDSVEVCFYLVRNNTPITPMVSAFRSVVITPCSKDTVECVNVRDSINIVDSLQITYVVKDSINIKDSISIVKVDTTLNIVDTNFIVEDIVMINIIDSTIINIHYKDSTVYNLSQAEVCANPTYVFSNTCEEDEIPCEIKLYPNPNGGDFKIDVSTTEYVYNIEVKFKDLLGNEIHNRMNSGEIGFLPLYTFDVWMFSLKGVYVAEVLIKVNSNGLDKEYLYTQLIVIQ